jgi:hypothetical protein
MIRRVSHGPCWEHEASFAMPVRGQLVVKLIALAFPAFARFAVTILGHS